MKKKQGVTKVDLGKQEDHSIPSELTDFKEYFEHMKAEEIKNPPKLNRTSYEQGRSFEKKWEEMEWTFNTIKKFFIWMFENFHWVVMGMCVVLGALAWWLISEGVIS